jgi:hypothetical protein
VLTFPAVAINARPSTGAWDSEALQYASGHTFTYQPSIGGSNAACTSGTDTCTVTLGGTPSEGDLLIVFIRANVKGYIASVTGETVTLCPSQGCLASHNIGSEDIAAVLSAAGGETTITVNLSADTTATWYAGVADFSWTGGGSLALDGYGNAGGPAAVTFAGPSLSGSMTGTSDLYFQNFKGATVFIGVGTANTITSTASGSPNTVTVASTTPANGAVVTLAGQSTAGCNVNAVTAALVTVGTTFTYTDTSCTSSATGGDWWLDPYTTLTALGHSLGNEFAYPNATSYTAPTFTQASSSSASIGALAIR